MKEVGVRALKNQLSHYLAQVRSGETVVVTDRGRPVARIQRVVLQDELPGSVQRLIEAGNLLYKDPHTDLSPPRYRLLPGRKTMADYVSEQRG